MYEYFHLAKWLRVPMLKEKTEKDIKDYKIFRAGTYIDVRVTISSLPTFDLT